MNNNIGVLVAAREFYMEYLKKYLSPLIVEGFHSIWTDAVNKETQEGKYEYIKTFQRLIKLIPGWNSTILEDETNRILERIPFLMKNVTAIFFSSVKILASIRTNRSSAPNIQIKIPDPDQLIHDIYIKSAYNIYTSLDVLYAFPTYYERVSDDLIKNTIKDSIEESISLMIPIQKILDEYIDDTTKEPQKIPHSQVQFVPGFLANPEPSSHEPESEPEHPRFSEPIQENFGQNLDNITAADPNAPSMEINTGKDVEDIDKLIFASESSESFSSDPTPMSSSDPSNDFFNDPFSSSASSAPAASSAPSSDLSDPFSSSASSEFSAPAASSVPSSDLSDPFSTSPSESSTTDDPFSTSPSESSTSPSASDPFSSSTPSTIDDPFSSSMPSVSDSSDPFSSPSEPSASDPFSSPSTTDDSNNSGGFFNFFG